MSKVKIVILGGGFGGVYAAKRLLQQIKRRTLDNIEVELISERNYLVFHPLLPEVAAGTINAQDAVTPLRLLLKGAKIRLAEVTDIDFQSKCVHLLQGQKRIIQSLNYDELIIASGQITNLSLLPGFEQHSMRMKDLSDAHRLRNHIINCLEMADITQFEDIKRRALTFVVVGGGFSGVETMGELVEMIRRTLPYYPHIEASEIRPILIQRGSQLLPEMNEKLGNYACQALQKRGVDIRLNTGIASATQHRVVTADSQTIETMTVVITIGNGPSAFVEKLGINLEKGKIVVDRHLRVVDTHNVWALGDTALIPLKSKSDNNIGVYAPPTAQFTVKEAAVVADNVLASLNDEALAPFDYKPKGMLASLGNYEGVAEILGLNIHGLPAWVIWRALYIGMLPGFSTRLRVALNWAFDYFLPRSIVHLSELPGHGTQYLHYQAGDIILQPDQIVDGFYVVASGLLVLEVPDKISGQTFRRDIRPGDHIGEQLLSHGKLSSCTLTAKKNSVILKLDTEDFLRMRSCFTGFDQYFKQLDPMRYSEAQRNLSASGDSDHTPI